jgi:hypothetical protein
MHRLVNLCIINTSFVSPGEVGRDWLRTYSYSCIVSDRNLSSLNQSIIITMSSTVLDGGDGSLGSCPG